MNTNRALIAYDESIEKDVYDAYKKYRAQIKSELRSKRSMKIMTAAEQRNMARERIMEYDYPFFDHYTLKYIVGKFEPLLSSYGKQSSN